MWIRKGVRLLKEGIGDGVPVECRRHCLMAMRLTLIRGEIVRHPQRCLPHRMGGHLETGDDGYFRHCVRIDRENLVGGIFYAVLGMHVGGYREVMVAPHLAYSERGIPGVIPPNAKLAVAGGCDGAG